MLRPSSAPSRKRERTTRAANRATSSGTKNIAVRPMPFCTPARRTPRVAIQTTARTMAMPGTKSMPNPLPARRKSSAKKVADSS